MYQAILARALKTEEAELEELMADKDKLLPKVAELQEQDLTDIFEVIHTYKEFEVPPLEKEVPAS